MCKRPVCSSRTSSIDWISRIAAVALTALFVSHAPAAGQSGDYYEPPAAPSDVPPEADYVPPPPDAAVPPPPPSDNDEEAVSPPDPGSPPPPEADADHSIPPPDEAESQPPLPAQFAEPLQPGEAYHTRFSGTVSQDAPGGPVQVIDLNGVVGSIVDLRHPGMPPRGQHWTDEPQRSPATAADAGQVFGIAIDAAKEPNIFITATSAFGLHLNPGGADWMTGMWGPDGGPGTVYRLSPETGYLPQPFAEIELDGRQNSGAALGNIAYDRWNRQLFVSDLETGMIHRVSGFFGKDLGHYDHGVSGRPRFVDAWTKTSASLPAVAFDPASRARIEDCPSGDFEKSPECWNYADFRRRVWGLAVRRDKASGEVRLYYSVWGSAPFGNAEWNGSGEDRRNSVWSVRIGSDGNFDTSDVRREFILPAFFARDPALGARAGNSHPVSDIEFDACGEKGLMLLAERGGIRNLGLEAEDAFARPRESRVLRYRLGSDGIWRPDGGYEIGFARDPETGVAAASAGGCSFGYGHDEYGDTDTEDPDGFVWMTGDNLCSPEGACFNPSTNAFDVIDYVDGYQGSPTAAASSLASAGSTVQLISKRELSGATPELSYMVDSDDNTNTAISGPGYGVDSSEATRIGDIDVYQPCELIDLPPPDTGLPPPPPPVHLRSMTHQRNASPMHNVDRSWHERNWSWHNRDASWHYRNRSWHSRERSWHSRSLSWHWRDRSWHSRKTSWHDRNRSWHRRDLSWHSRDRSWHDRNRSWHSKALSWHWRDRSWHSRDISWHYRNRSWHRKDASWHDKRRSAHRKDLSFHSRERSWHLKDRSWHDKRRSAHRKDLSLHSKDRSWHLKNKSWHNTRRSELERHNKARSEAERHSKARSDAAQHNKARSEAERHSKARSDAAQHNKARSEAERHSKARSDAARHSKARSEAERHSKARSDAARHNKARSEAERHSKARSDAARHSKARSDAARHNKARSEAERHSKARSDAARHNKARSEAERHSKARSDAARHNKARSDAAQHNRARSDAARHSRAKSNAQLQPNERLRVPRELQTR